MKYSLIIMLLATGLATGCSSDDKDSEVCLHGESLGYNCCTGYTIVAVKSFVRIGKSYTQNNITYPNTIQVPGDYGTGDFYFRVRPFNIETDANDPPCYCIISVPLNLPYYTITASSPSGCP